MRKLNKLRIKDKYNLKLLTKSHKKSAKNIALISNQILGRYRQYLNAKGNPHSIAIDPAFDAYKDELIDVYSSPPVSFDFIDKLRGELEGACPMCGRDGLGTLDHYLPKSIFSEFSFLSWNLIPACNRCNNPRQTMYIGTNPERAIHPYYDTFLAERIFTIEFDPSPNWDIPLIKPVSFNLLGNDKSIFDWHIENIIKPSGIKKYLDNQWSVLCGKPNLFLGDNNDPFAVRAELERLEKIEEAKALTPNGWMSAFYHGLARDPEAIDHLAGLINPSV